MSTIINKLKYLKETKKLIQQAIIDKGVLVEDDDTFRNYASLIADIPAADGDTKLYKKCLDDIYLACIGRGLQVDKSDPESFAENISKLRKIDLNFAFTEDLTPLSNVGIDHSTAVDVDLGLSDSLIEPGIYDPTTAVFSEDLSSLSNIEIKHNNKIEVNLGIELKLSTSVE